MLNQVGQEIAPSALSHYRTCGSAYGGSHSMLKILVVTTKDTSPSCVNYVGGQAQTICFAPAFHHENH
jgi:hypothetical protein